MLIPLLAGWAWTLFDFAAAGALIFGVGLTYELAARKAGDLVYRFAVGVALAGAFLLVWINLAVGIIGDSGDPANTMYVGVLAVGLIGAIIARFHPPGMARALFATALTQAFVALIALVLGLGSGSAPGVVGILVLNGFFVALFLGSAWLFRTAAGPVSPGSR